MELTKHGGHWLWLYNDTFTVLVEGRLEFVGGKRKKRKDELVCDARWEFWWYKMHKALSVPISVNRLISLTEEIKLIAKTFWEHVCVRKGNFSQ